LGAQSPQVKVGLKAGETRRDAANLKVSPNRLDAANQKVSPNPLGVADQPVRVNQRVSLKTGKGPLVAINRPLARNLNKKEPAHVGRFSV
jgi:hypothetical protein